MRLRDVFRTMTEATTYPWGAMGSDEDFDVHRWPDGWEPWWVGALPDGVVLVYLRRRVPFMERLARWWRLRKGDDVSGQVETEARAHGDGSLPEVLEAHGAPAPPAP